MIVDLHRHANRSSYCSSLNPQEMLDRAKDLALDAVAVTEHSVPRGARIAYEMGLEQGFTVFRGIEVYTKMGDVIVFGLGGEAHYDADFFELMEEVGAKGAFTIAAHPSRGYWGHHRRYKGVCPDEVFHMVDAVETHNGQSTRDANELALGMQRRFGLIGTGGSDAHLAGHVGRCVTVFESGFASEEELIRELKAGRCHGAYLSDIARATVLRKDMLAGRQTGEDGGD